MRRDDKLAWENPHKVSVFDPGFEDPDCIVFNNKMTRRGMFVLQTQLHTQV